MSEEPVFLLFSKFYFTHNKSKSYYLRLLSKFTTTFMEHARDTNSQQKDITKFL